MIFEIEKSYKQAYFSYLIIYFLKEFFFVRCSWFLCFYFDVCSVKFNSSNHFFACGVFRYRLHIFYFVYFFKWLHFLYDCVYYNFFFIFKNFNTLLFLRYSQLSRNLRNEMFTEGIHRCQNLYGVRVYFDCFMWKYFK